MRNGLLGLSLLALASCAVVVDEAGTTGGTGGSSSSGGPGGGSGTNGGGSSTTPFVGCGDGITGTGELCDWGTPTGPNGCTGPNGGCNSNLPNSCRPDCTLPTCGDGIVDTGEKCDLGSANGTEAGCNATCTLFGQATRIVGNGDRGDGGLCEFSCYQDGPGAEAMFQEISGLAVIGSTLYVADTLNELIRAVDLSSAPAYNVTTLAGNPTTATTLDGTGSGASFFLPLAPMAYQGTLLVGTGMNIRQITLPGGAVTTLAGPDNGNKASENSANGVSLSAALFNKVTGLTLDPATGFIYSVDQGSGLVRQVEPAAEVVNDLAGGSTAGANFANPMSGVVIDSVLFISDTSDNLIEAVTLGSQPSATVVAGSGGAGYSNANGPYKDLFNTPQGMCTDGQSIYIVDTGNKAVRQMDPVSYALSTVVGGPDAGVFNSPYACAWNPATQALYVSDQSIPSATPDGIGNVIYMIQ